MPKPNESRIAIRFGASSSRAPYRNPQRPAPSSALGKRHRPRFDHDESGSDSEGSENKEAHHQSITHFGADGAEDVDEQRTRRDQGRSGDWDSTRHRIESPRAKSQIKYDEPGKHEADEPEETLQYGLVISKKPNHEERKLEDKAEDTPREPKTADEEAMDALMGHGTGKRKMLHLTEDDAYHEAAAGAPAEDDLATYEEVPVEGFGASLLMGQGWDGKMRGPKVKEITRRPNGMGLGSKKMAGEEDLGGWDSKGRGRGRGDKRPRLDEYRRDRDKDRSRREDRHRDSYKNERDRERNGDRYRDSERERERDRDRNRDRDRDSHKSRRRDDR